MCQIRCNASRPDKDSHNFWMLTKDLQSAPNSSEFEKSSLWITDNRRVPVYRSCPASCLHSLCFIIMDLRGASNRLVLNTGKDLAVFSRFFQTSIPLWDAGVLDVSLNTRCSSKKRSHLRSCADWGLATPVFHPKRLVNKQFRTGAIWKCALDV